MTGDMLRKYRGDRTQVKYAEELGVTANTLARWERGEMRIPEPVARLVKCLRRADRLRSEVKRLRGHLEANE